MIKDYKIKRADILFNKIKKENPGRVLDIGCQWGLLLSKLKKLEFEVYGIEIDKDAIEYCRKELKLNILEHDLESGELPFENDYFDYVICSNVLEHIDARRKILCEIKRVLKDNGKVYVVLPNEFTLRTKLNVLFKNKFEVHPDHKILFSYNKGKKLLKENLNIIEEQAIFKSKLALEKISKSLFASEILFICTKR